MFLRIVLVSVVIYLLIRLLLRIYSFTTILKKSNKKTNEQFKMVACEKCGLYIPQKDAILDNGKYFCSIEHAQN